MAASSWETAWLKSKNDPLRFVTDVLGASPDPWQVEALNKIAAHDRVSIRAGHGVGKTTLIGWVVPWFLTTRMNAVVPITANSQDQLRDVVWPEIKRWHRKLPEGLREQLECTVERVFLKAAPELGFAVARTASKDRPEALQGFHAENMLFIIEEASGIPEEVFEVAQGALSTAGAKALMLSNPTRLSGLFYETHHRLRAKWATMRVNAEDVPRARGHIDDIISTYGKDSNRYRVRVLGDFPTAEDEQVIPLALVEAATRRDVTPPVDMRVVWGLDVARFGDDRSALAKRRGNVLLEPVKAWRNKDTMQTASLVMAAYNDTLEIDQPSEILVDVVGIGAGVCDRLHQLGLPARGVNVGESPAAGERYMRLRDELWFRARQWFEARDCAMPKDDALIAELTAPTYGFTASEKIVVERKVDLKARGLPSPDLADAFILTLAGGLDRIPEAEREHRGYGRRRYEDMEPSWVTV